MNAIPAPPTARERTATPVSSVPPWALALFTDTEASGYESQNGLDCRVLTTRQKSTGQAHRLVSYRVPDAVDLDATAFEDSCAAAYRALARDLESSGAPSVQGPWNPVRLWNFVPHILEPLGGLEHRYMSFNAGRYRALSEQLGGASSFDRRVATASGVGHFGRDLWLHCLASETDGAPIENPRQTPAYRYSKRFGPLPPCFARATRVELSSSLLLVGGTASVVGEDSCHVGDLERQLGETLCNLATLVHVGVVNGHRLPSDPLPTGDGLLPLLHRYSSLRVYYPRPEDLSAIRTVLADRIAPTTEIEYVHADLCRPELLVEIEGVAHLGALAERQRTRFESGLLAAAALAPSE